MTAIGFKFTRVIKEGELDESDKINQDELSFLEARNILVTKNLNTEEQQPKEVKKVISIEFHSRRTQYAFGRHFLRYEETYWKEKGEPARLELQQQLERGEYKYILDYEVQRLKKRLEKIEKEVKKKNTKGEESKGRVEEHRSLINLTELETEQAMHYYQAYQSQRGENYEMKVYFRLKEIFKDLKKGPKHFYQKYEAEVSKGLKGKEGLKKKIEETQKNIAAVREKPGVLNLREQIYEEEAAMYLEELEGTKGFKLQKSLTKEDFTKIQEEVDEKKVSQALRQFYLFLNPYEKQVATTALELAVDAQRRLVGSHKEKTQKQKVDQTIK